MLLIVVDGEIQFDLRLGLSNRKRRVGKKPVENPKESALGRLKLSVSSSLVALLVFVNGNGQLVRIFT